MNEEMTTSISEMGSPSLLNELLDTYNDNFHTIEKTALDLLASSEIAVFNGLRNLSSQECVKLLDRVHRRYVTDGNFVDYFVSLAVMTEYICTAYRNPHLYDTFHVAMGTKSEEMLFDKLCQRWLQVYRNHNLSNHVNSTLFGACFNILKYSAEQFSSSFIPKNNLYKTIRTGEEVLHLLGQRNSGMLAGQRLSSEKKKLTQPFVKDHFSGKSRSGEKISANSSERNLSVSISETKKKGWMFERGIPQSPSMSADTITMKTHLGPKVQGGSPAVPAPQNEKKSKGWFYERVVLQSPATNIGTYTPVTDSEIRSLETDTSMSTPTMNQKKKSKGWMFERIVLQTTPKSEDKSSLRISTPAKKLFATVSTAATNDIDNVSERTVQCHTAISASQEPVSIDTIDLTTNESPKKTTIVASNKKRPLQNSVQVNKDMELTDVTKSSEPPKKKIRNAFDVLMRRDSKKIVASSSVLVA